MRRSLFSFFAFLSLQTVFFEPCYAKEDEDGLENFINKIQAVTISFELWYSNYTAHTPFLSQGRVHDANKDLYLVDSSLQISNWTSTSNGGGIATNICSLDHMYAPIFFKNNYTQGQGGGIYAATQCIIQNNDQPVCFDRNVSRNWGGAIHSDSINIENNPESIYFLSNSTANQNGGALDAKSITIKNCGHILFFNNSGIAEGGAILCEDRSSTTNLTRCEISADYGNVVFYDNIVTTPDKRNALQSNRNSLLLLGAKKHHAIKFFDPIVFRSTNTTSASPATLNYDKDHQGIILFSSKYIAKTEETIPDRFSYFNQACSLENGIVRVTDGAGLALYKFTQSDGILCLGNSATITTTNKQGSNTQGCNLAITKLALDLPSIRKVDSSIPKIWVYPSKRGNTYSEDNKPTITVSGDLIFLDKKGDDPYDSMDLSKPLNNIPLLYIWDNATPRVDLTNFNPDGVNAQEHYGYQGTWEMHWMNQPMVTNSSSAFTANSSRSILYGSWTPTGYLVNPKHNTPLVANAIWESVYTLMPGMQLGAMFDDLSPSHLDGQLAGMVHVQTNHKGTPGFHMRTKSYWAGGKYAGLHSQKLYLHVGQSFSHIKEKRTKNKLDSKNYGVAFKINSSIKDDALYLSASLGYAYSVHKTKHLYENNHHSTGEFFSSTIGVFAHLLKPLTISFCDKKVSSFVEAHLFQSMISSFKENGEFPRKFKTNRPFYDLSLPIGIVIRSTEKLFACPGWSCKLAYQPTLYRSKPSIKTTLLSSNASWINSGTKVSKHALNLQLNSEVDLLSHLTIQCSYEGSFSLTTVCNYATLKGVLSF